MKKIVLTGGGTAGQRYTEYCIVNRRCRQPAMRLPYVGSYEGIEKKLIAELNIPYTGISYRKIPQILRSEELLGSFPCHEGIRGGTQLSEKLSAGCSIFQGRLRKRPRGPRRSFLTYSLYHSRIGYDSGAGEQAVHSRGRKGMLQFPGDYEKYPCRQSCPDRFSHSCGAGTGQPAGRTEHVRLTANKPVIMVIGGSLGAANVNKAVRDALPKLLEDFQVVHLCGKDKIDNLLLNTPGYKQFEYIKAELKDIFAMADVVISRAGANAICELLALKKPNILIPLPAASSRGDQLLNAASFEAQGYSIVLNEDDITTNLLVDKVHELYFNRQKYVEAMSRSHQMDAVNTIMSLINEAANKSHTQ